MLAFANRTPGIIEYYRDLSARAEGSPVAEEDGENELIKIYEEGLKRFARS